MKHSVLHREETKLVFALHCRHMEGAVGIYSDSGLVWAMEK